ncbi:PREDICTED: uncharacterized protein LOC106537476 [Thamnophis sirtalis]|uniref:Uncharacterized protein LOC106537476 n=1 Tax=Thamnophis sirtalis TaxID=35019 RepID=A0A6I9X6S5_9SAUR|nr:PREDICTED: uncharacterized protein LOC106537476 [Thamnophis sirtalis]
MGSPSTPKLVPARALPKTRAKAPLAKKVLPTKKALPAKKATKKAIQIPPKALDPVGTAGGKEQERPLVDGAAACSASQSAQPSSLPPASTPLPPESPSEEPAAKTLQVAASVSPKEPLPAMEPPKKPVSGGKVDLSTPKPGVGKGSPSTPKRAPARALPKAPLAKKVLPAKKAVKVAQRPQKALNTVGAAAEKELAQPSSLPTASTPLPPESPSEEPAAKWAKPATPEAAVPPAVAGVCPKKAQEPEMTPQMRRMISEAIAQGIAAGIQQQHPASSAASDNALRQGQAPPSSMNIPESLDKDLPLSGDQDGTPDPHGFVGLFSPALFKTLLQKAKATARIGGDPAGLDPASSDPNNLLFTEPATEKEEIPCPKFFLDVVQRQWAVLGSGPHPTINDKRFYNVGPNLTAAFDPPTIDEPVAAFPSYTVLSTNTDGALNPEEKKIEMALVMGHKSAAWAVKSAMAASFFNRTSLLWLKQMRARIPVTDLQTHEDINNLIAAAEFSADATLNSVRFASKSIGSSVTGRRVLWLRNWKSNMKFKWKLACAPFKGEKLFGEALEPILIETRDKKKVLPSTFRKPNKQSSPYFQKPPFRAADTAEDCSQPQRAYFQRPDHQSDSPRYRGRGRQQFQSKRPLRGSSRSLQSQPSRGPEATGDCNAKSFYELESDTPPKKTHQASGIQEFQNPVHTGGHLGGRLPDVNRSHGNIPGRPYIADSPMISMDMQREPPLQSPHEDTSDALGSPQGYPYSRPTLSGRHVDRIRLSPPRHRGSTHHDPGPSGSFRESGIHSQQRQEPLASYRQDTPPSSSYRNDMHSLPVPGPPGQHQRSGELDSIGPNGASRPRLTIVRQGGVLRLPCSRGTSAYQDITMVPPAYPEIQQEQFNYQSPIRGPPGVDATDHNQGMPIPGTEQSHHRYGRWFSGLESPDRDPDGRRPVDTRGMTNQRQLGRDPSRPQSPPMDPDHHLRPPHPSRQRSHQDPYEPPREHPLEDIDYRRLSPFGSPPGADFTDYNQGNNIQETEPSRHRSRGRFSRLESPDRDPDGRRPVDRRGTMQERQPIYLGRRRQRAES